MTQIFILSVIITIILCYFLYNNIGLNNVKDCMKMWFDSDYWKPTYNKVEFAAWFSKGIIIFPGLLFEKQIWWLFVISLITSSLLIWVSMKKLLPTLIAFNSLWIFISITAIIKHFMS
jgi:hypothetical protein